MAILFKQPTISFSVRALETVIMTAPHDIIVCHITSRDIT